VQVGTPAATYVRFGTGAVGVDPAGHDLGSHGWSLEEAVDGEAIDADGVAVEMVGGPAVVEPPAADAVAGAFTANWVPVTTVT
jgi:hypothetical protein